MPGANVPTIQSGSTPATITIPSNAQGGPRQALVENTDTLNDFTVAWNGSGGAWRLQAGSRLGLYVVGGMQQLVLTPVAGNPTYQCMFFA
jgi:hypothetical protein